MVFIYNEWLVFVVGMVVAVGPLAFHLYGLLIGLGILLGAFAGGRIVKVKMSEVWDGLLWVVGGGLVGARLYHVLDYFSYYWLHPGEIVMLWKGGMGIFGGMVGGVVGLYWWLKRENKLKQLRKYLDVVGFGLPVGQFIGRWGNYFNQELYGKPTSLLWGIYIRPENRLIEVMDYEKFHPLFLYEGLWNLVGFVGLWWLVKNKRIKLGKGGVLITYLGWYGLGRFWLEFLRIETWQIYGMNVAQVIGLGLVGLAVYWWRKNLTKKLFI